MVGHVQETKEGGWAGGSTQHTVHEGWDETLNQKTSQGEVLTAVVTVHLSSISVPARARTRTHSHSGSCCTRMLCTRTHSHPGSCCVPEQHDALVVKALHDQVAHGGLPGRRPSGDADDEGLRHAPLAHGARSCVHAPGRQAIAGGIRLQRGEGERGKRHAGERVTGANKMAAWLGDKICWQSRAIRATVRPVVVPRCGSATLSRHVLDQSEGEEALGVETSISTRKKGWDRLIMM